MHLNTGRYLAFLGRISPDRGVEQAIELAKRTDMPIRIAACIDPVDQHSFEHIAPFGVMRQFPRSTTTDDAQVEEAA